MARIYHAYSPITEHPTAAMQQAYAAQNTANASAQNMANSQISNLLGLGQADPYAGTRFARSPEDRPPERQGALNEWYARLEARVAEIEADDSVMGKKETKRWMGELAAFKADLS